MIRATFIAVTTIVFSALFAGFIVFERTNAQTTTVSPVPTNTVTPTPTGTVPSGAPNTGRAE